MARAIAVKVDGKGRLTIPARVRKELEIQPGDTFFVQREGKIIRYAKSENPFDLLAEHAVKEYRAGKTKSLRQFASDRQLDEK